MTARRSCRSPAARFGIRREFLEDLGETNSREALAQLGRPLMIFHNPHDTIVSVDKRAADLRGRPPSQELRLARRRRSPPLETRRRDLRRTSPGRMGDALPVSEPAATERRRLRAGIARLALAAAVTVAIVLLPGLGWRAPPARPRRAWVACPRGCGRSAPAHAAWRTRSRSCAPAIRVSTSGRSATGRSTTPCSGSAFRALGHPPPVAVIATAYLIGQLGAAVPLPAGIGGVDVGLIGTLVLFHAPTAAAAAVVSYRAIQLWVPAIMGGVSLSRLRSVLIPDGVDTRRSRSGPLRCWTWRVRAWAKASQSM